MRRSVKPSKKERKILFWANFVHYVCPILILLIPCSVAWFLNEMGVEPHTCGVVFWSLLGVGFFGFGVYHIIGALFGWKHLLVCMQKTNPPHLRQVNPRRNWDASEKRESIFVGVLFSLLGIAAALLLPFL